MAGKLQAMARELVRSSVVGCACDCVHYLECTHRSLDEWTPIAPFSSITRASVLCTRAGKLNPIDQIGGALPGWHMKAYIACKHRITSNSRHQ